MLCFFFFLFAGLRKLSSSIGLALSVLIDCPFWYSCCCCCCFCCLSPPESDKFDKFSILFPILLSWCHVRAVAPIPSLNTIKNLYKPNKKCLDTTLSSSLLSLHVRLGIDPDPPITRTWLGYLSVDTRPPSPHLSHSLPIPLSLSAFDEAQQSLVNLIKTTFFIGFLTACVFWHVRECFKKCALTQCVGCVCCAHSLSTRLIVLSSVKCIGWASLTFDVVTMR